MVNVIQDDVLSSDFDVLIFSCDCTCKFVTEDVQKIIKKYPDIKDIILEDDKRYSCNTLKLGNTLRIEAAQKIFYCAFTQDSCDPQTFSDCLALKNALYDVCYDMREKNELGKLRMCSCALNHKLKCGSWYNTKKVYDDVFTECDIDLYVSEMIADKKLHDCSAKKKITRKRK